MPDAFDWIQLTSGEWLKGELIGLFDGSLEFDSDELDNLTLDWGDIRQVRTARVVQVRFSDREEPVTGRLLVDGDSVRVLGDTDQSFTRGTLMSIAPGEPREANYWSGNATFGFNLRRGNSEQVEANTIANAKRRTVRTRVGLDYVANYNVTDDLTVTNNQRLNAGLDWFVTPRLFVRPVVVEYYRDPFQNFAHRLTIGAAVGYQLVDTPRVSWEVNVGPSYQRTIFDSVVEGESDAESTAALSAGTTYTNELTSDIDYTLDYRFLVVKPEAGRYYSSLHHGAVRRRGRSARPRRVIRLGPCAGTASGVVGSGPEEGRLSADLRRRVRFLGPERGSSCRFGRRFDGGRSRRASAGRLR